MGIGNKFEDDESDFQVPFHEPYEHEEFPLHKQDGKMLISDLLMEEFLKPPTKEEATQINDFFSSHFPFSVCDENDYSFEDPITFSFEWKHKKGKSKPQQYWVYCEENQANYATIQLQSRFINIQNRSRIATCSTYPNYLVFIEDCEAEKTNGIILKEINFNRPEVLEFSKSTLTCLPEKDFTFSLFLEEDTSAPVHPLQGSASSVKMHLLRQDMYANPLPFSSSYQVFFKNRSEGWFKLKSSLSYHGQQLFEGKSPLFMFNNPRMKNKKSLMKFSPLEIKFMQSFSLEVAPNEEHWLELGIQLGFGARTTELLSQSRDLFHSVNRKTKKRQRSEVLSSTIRKFPNLCSDHDISSSISISSNFPPSSSSVSASSLFEDWEWIGSEGNILSIPNLSSSPLSSSPPGCSSDDVHASCVTIEEILDLSKSESPSLHSSSPSPSPSSSSSPSSGYLQKSTLQPFSINHTSSYSSHINTLDTSFNNNARGWNILGKNKHKKYTILYQWLDSFGNLKQPHFKLLDCNVNSLSSFLLAIFKNDNLPSSFRIGKIYTLERLLFGNGGQPKIMEIRDSIEFANILSLYDDDQTSLKLILTPLDCKLIPTTSHFSSLSCCPFPPSISSSLSSSLFSPSSSISHHSSRDDDNNIEEFTFTVSLNGDIREVYCASRTLSELKNSIAQEFQLSSSQIVNITKELTKASIVRDKNVEKLKENEVLLVHL